MKVTVIFALIALLVACEARSSRGKVRYHQPTKKETRAARIATTARIDEPEPYSFEYAIKDPATNNNYGHQEVSDGRVVTGEYRVLLPDGRTQIVTYRADENGYRAKVRYEGEAVYPPTPAKPAYAPSAYSSKYA